MTELILKEEVYAIAGAAMEVYNGLGPGFLEAVYQVALETELKLRQIPFEAQKDLAVFYKGQPLSGICYRPDLLAYGQIVVELKALDRLGANEIAQAINYLKATRSPVAVLINFGNSKQLEWK